MCIFIDNILAEFQKSLELINNNYNIYWLVNISICKRVGNIKCLLQVGVQVQIPVQALILLILLHMQYQQLTFSLWIFFRVIEGWVNDQKSDLIKAFIHSILVRNKSSVVRVLIFSMSDTTWSYKSISILWPFLRQTIATVSNICM